MTSMRPAGLLAWALCVACHAAPQQDRASGEAQFLFDIPAMPLAQALQDYAARTRLPTLYRSEIIDGRQSTPLHGAYAAAQGLDILLQGTGLVAEAFADGSARGFILTAAAVDAAGGAATAGFDARPAQYAAWLQRQVWQGLCRDPQAAPGDYRALLRFRVQADGHLAQPRLLTASGSATRDNAILATLQQLQLTKPPPANMPQPVTLLIVATDAQASERCAGDEAQP